MLRNVTGRSPAILYENSEKATHPYGTAVLDIWDGTALIDIDKCVSAITCGRTLHLISDVGHIWQAGYTDDNIRLMDSYMPKLEHIAVEGETRNGSSNDRRTLTGYHSRHNETRRTAST